MPDFKLSANARNDLFDIADYTTLTFGPAQSLIYRDGLIDAFETLAVHPRAGVSMDHIKTGARRLTHESHVIYYRMKANHVLILRVLHHSQDPMRHL